MSPEVNPSAKKISTLRELVEKQNIYAIQVVATENNNDGDFLT